MKGEVLNVIINGVVMADLSYKEVIKPYAWLFRVTGILPFEGQGFNFVLSRFLVMYMFITTFIAQSMISIYGIVTTVEGQAWTLEDVYVTALTVDVYARYWLLLWRRKRFTSLFEECAQLWSFCDAKGRATVKRHEHKIRMFYGIYVFNFYMMNILIPINAYFMRLPPLEPNGTEQRVLAFKWFVRDEPYKLLGYDTTFAIQTIAIQSGITCAIASNSFVSIFAMLGAGYFRQLADYLADLPQQIDRNEILSCIKYHQRLLQFSNNLNEFARTTMLSYMAVSCYTMSLVLIKLNGTDPGKYSHLPIMINCMFQLFLIQWPQDVRSDESEKMAYATYSTLMKRLDDKRLCSSLQITLIRAQHPMFFHAGGFITLSFETYTTMMRGAFSFFMVLQSLNVQ